MVIASFVKDVACDMIGERHFVVQDPEAQEPVHQVHENMNLAEAEDLFLAATQATWPAQSRSWRKEPTEGETVGELMPGMWNTPAELGVLPRLRVLEGWNPDLSHAVPPFHPTCLSARSSDPRFNLTPTFSEGWEYWVHPDHLDKPYVVASEPGSRVEFELETSVGVIKMYSLRSRTFGLGSVSCWVDDEVDRAVNVEGYWDNDA
jgi:hypothetical protein